MTNCNSVTTIHDTESCSLQCVDTGYSDKVIADPIYHIRHSVEHARDHQLCVDKCVAAKQNEPSSIGCFKDAWERDLPTQLGTDLTIEQCISAGKLKKLKYVGVEAGNECWGDDTIGKYGKAQPWECTMPCSRDKGSMCGGAFRNRVYDLGDLNRRS